MRLMLVFCHLSMGGVETLIVRMARHLSKQGHKVFVVLITKRANAELLSELKEHAEVIYAKNIYHLPAFNLLRRPPEKIDFIHCFNSLSLYASIIIRNDYYPTSPIITGVYFPREYYFPGGNHRFNKKITEEIFRQLPISNIFFMNKECATAHRPCTNSLPADEIIIPLPIDTEKYRSAMRSPSRNRIVSVGRLTNFKTYTFHTIDAIAELKARGHSLEYHIYGDGEDRIKLETYVESKKMGSSVHLHGNLPYDQFPDAMKDAFVFIGMGTSLIEASACGVPSLIAIESNQKPTTYGLFSRSLGYNSGERTDELTELSLADQIEAIVNLDDNAYSNACKEAIEKAESFSIERSMRLYTQQLRKVVRDDISITAAAKIGSFIDWWAWRLLKRLGIVDPYAHRYGNCSVKQDNG